MTRAARASSKTSNRRSSEVFSESGLNWSRVNSRPRIEAVVSVSLQLWESRFSRLPITSRTPSGIRTVQESVSRTFSGLNLDFLRPQNLPPGQHPVCQIPANLGTPWLVPKTCHQNAHRPLANGVGLQWGELTRFAIDSERRQTPLLRSVPARVIEKDRPVTTAAGTSNSYTDYENAGYLVVTGCNPTSKHPVAASRSVVPWWSAGPRATT